MQNLKSYEYEIRDRGDLVDIVFDLNIIDTTKYFGESIDLFDEREFMNYLNFIVDKYSVINKRIDNGVLTISLYKGELSVLNDLIYQVLSAIRSYKETHETHITRMFGSYILLTKESGKLKAIKATPIPIKYCPLMVKLLKEVGGDVADELLKALNVEDEKTQTEAMCKLINEVVIDGGYFDTSRPLNSCEANVLFGASETIYSAFVNNLIDGAVIVSNNLGTIITRDAETTQGCVKRMTGLFYTSPSEEIVETANTAGIDVVFPYTGRIDQMTGVKKSIELGMKRIAVSVAAEDNVMHDYFKELESSYGVKIYKFGLCSTGISEDAAISMRNNADVVWSCASKNVKEFVEPNAIFQVGVKIPVSVMTPQGFEIIKSHLKVMDPNLDVDNIDLVTGDEKMIVANSGEHLKLIHKKELNKCLDCPHPCV